MTIGVHAKACLEAMVFVALLSKIHADEADPFSDIEHPLSRPPPSSSVSSAQPLLQFLWRRELSAMGIGEIGDNNSTCDSFLRLSAGLESRVSFSTPTRTWASANLQLRLVYRNSPLDTELDPMGRTASRWEIETHNAYLDLFAPVGPPGRVNLRFGRAYLPFGLNVQTDTHATLLPLSNDRLFGTERDWQLTAYGQASESLDYWLGYLLGSGMDQELKGQSGLLMGRLALNPAWLYEHHWEGGLSAAVGERVDPHSGIEGPIRTWRTGVDARHRWDTPYGPLTATVEIGGGEDGHNTLLSFLGQMDWISTARRLGIGLQYRVRDREQWGSTRSMSHDDKEPASPQGGTDHGITAVLTRYFRNDPNNATLHWLALAVEVPFNASDSPTVVRPALAYYRYW